MGRTEFLSTLHPADECPAKANRVAERFMRTKGYGDRTPIGVYVDGQMLYYYYRLPEGVLEIELMPVEGRWHRRVSDFITQDREIAEMLGECQPLTDTRAKPLVREPVKTSAPAPPVTFRGASA